jgi:HSP20 family protein
MTLVRWNPSRELASMEIDQLNRMFGQFYGAFHRSWLPAVDIYETDAHEYVIKAELPDMKREDINITVENSVLTLKGERKAEFDAPSEHAHRIERHHGAFTRSFVLPSTVDANRISASYKDGVLTLRIPQREDAKPRQIQVDVAGL